MNYSGPIFSTGLGYSPSSGPPVGGGGYRNIPVTTFFGDDVQQLLPSQPPVFFFGRRRFGYPLSNLPSRTIDMQTFPKPPIGPGNTPGGNGGVWLQGMPSSQQYWGFGVRGRSKSRKLKKCRSHKKRKGKSLKNKL